MKIILMPTLLLLILGCVSIQPLGKAAVDAICNAEYNKMNEKISGKASSVSFRIEPAGTLLQQAQHKKDKAARQGKGESKDLFSEILSAGNDFPDIGARAACIVWTDSENITFTTTDEVYDIQATLLYEAGRIPTNLRILAKNISDKYDQRRK